MYLNQKEAAQQAGIDLVIVGALERGERNATPEAYATFLYKNGIDLNRVFNNDANDKNILRKETAIDNSTGKLLIHSPDKNIFINQELPEKSILLITH